MKKQKLPHRIWTNGPLVGSHRDLIAITRTERGELLFELDGGEKWTFTTREKITAPKIEEVDILGYARNSRTGAVTNIAHLILREPKRVYQGNISITTAEASALAEIRSAITTEKERRSAAASKAGRAKKRSSQYSPEDLRRAIALAHEKLRAGWKQQAACEEAIEHFTLPLSWKALMYHINKNKRKRTPK